jgi:curli biogenesis system outer membrane secretion channel CsgG
LKGISKMQKSPRNSRYCIALLLVAAGSALGAIANAADAPPPQIPTCDKKIGTLAVAEPQNQWWTALNLESPAALIKVFVSESKCFTLVDRGKGLQAAQAERALAASGEERQGSNIGKGQMKAADYVLVPDIANQNRNSGGTNIGGMLGGLLPHGVGAVVGGVSMKSKTADVVLTLTDVRSTEQVALEQGHAKKTDIGWMGGGGGGSFFGGFAGGGASSYANTEIGQVVTMAYLDAYTKLVGDLKNAAPDAKAENVQQSVTMSKPGKMYAESNLKSQVVRNLDPGMMLYPTGDKMGVWWKVTDELGNVGWVVSTNFQLAH